MPSAHFLDVPSVCPGWLMTILLLAPPTVLLFRDDVGDWWYRQRRAHADYVTARAFEAQRAALAPETPAPPRRDPSPRPHHLSTHRKQRAA